MIDKYVGTKLEDRYEIIEMVGEGGMANVYRGKDLQENRIVAIKILKDEFNSNAELVRRFKNESRAISVLNHPNIVKVFDISVSDDMQYIVMEYIDGITLKTYIDQRGEPLTYKETVHFVSQILRALQHAHDKGIVHRDIKPQNIMLLEDGTLKVMDFGIARLSRSESHTVTDQAIGSVHYISPEQAKGDLTDPRADIYSLGITMYEMLTATLPFESDNAVSIAIKQISDEAVPVRKVNPSVPPGLESITMKAMEKDPRRRYQGALDMLRDIEEFRKNPNIRFDYENGGGEATRYVNTVGKANGKKTNGGKAASTQGKGRKPKKKLRLLVPITAAITFIVVATCVILCISIFQNSGNPLFGEVREVELPNFVGMHISEVQELLKQEGYSNFRLQEPVEEYKPDVPAGVVISQNPTPPKQVKETQKIYLVISQGIQTKAIPDLSGMTRAEATQAILDMGMRPYVKSIEDANVEVGKVIGTDPVAFAEVDATPDTLVVIYVSGRPKDIEREVPNLVGMTEMSEVKKLLDDNNLQIGVTMEEYSEEYPIPGTIIKTVPEAGQKVEIYKPVHLTISLGPPPPPEPEKVGVPGVIGDTPTAAGAKLADAGLGMSTGPGVYSDTVPAGNVANQSPGPGAEVEIGSVVTVQLSMGPDPATPPPPASSSEPPSSSSGGGSLPPPTPTPGGHIALPPLWNAGNRSNGSSKRKREAGQDEGKDL